MFDSTIKPSFTIERIVPIWCILYQKEKYLVQINLTFSHIHISYIIYIPSQSFTQTISCVTYYPTWLLMLNVSSFYFSSYCSVIINVYYQSLCAIYYQNLCLNHSLMLQFMLQLMLFPHHPCYKSYYLIYLPDDVKCLC